MNEQKNSMSREIDALRIDLQELKKCQVQYFTLAISGTGATLGLAAILQTSFKGVALLAPLAIIIPCALVFFDKATTITRLVGYIRILEEQLRESKNCYQDLGYENALAEYRIHEYDAWKKVRLTITGKIPNLWVLLSLRTRHRYWMINWYTFEILAFICCLGSYTLLTNKIVDLFLPFGIHLSLPERTLWTGSAFVLVLLTTYYTLQIVISLTRGRLSYNACTQIWRYILQKQGSSHECKPINTSENEFIE
jgi:hypothetical protein